MKDKNQPNPAIFELAPRGIGRLCGDGECKIIRSIGRREPAVMRLGFAQNWRTHDGPPIDGGLYAAGESIAHRVAQDTNIFSCAARIAA